MTSGERRDDLKTLLGGMRAAASPFQAALEDLHDELRAVDEGRVASYIPELARANPGWFGICVATVDGRVFAVGDAEQPFTIQSVSKPFMYGLALEDIGREGMLERVGVEPTGDAFNAIVLDEATNRPYNPMVNAGAIAVAGHIQGADPTERLNRVLAMFERYAGRPILMDASVFTSERTTGHRNRAIAYLMRNFGMIGERIDEILDLYFQQCSLLVTCRDLAMMGATLANGGVNPVTGATAIDRRYVTDVLSVMYTCGMYDFSGEWAYKVGMPAKSGVGGGIVAVVPGRLGIGVFAPPLDARGNSVRGVRACAALAERFGLHIFSRRDGPDPLAAALEGRVEI
ncbi:MAG: glutaminase A [Chloroflexales bacterium]|nr:glutaminase A [Chloroflexales bacterium]